MKVEKMFHIHLSVGEVKSAILNYLILQKIDPSYLEHMSREMWDIDIENDGFVVITNGSVKGSVKDPL